MKHLFLTLIAVFAFNASATVYVEGTDDYLDSVFQSHGQYHTDTTSGLDWLNFSDLVEGDNDWITMQNSVNSAETYYGQYGWRLATYTEVYGLFDLFFDSYSGTDGRMELDDRADPTAPLIEARNSWMFAFGTSVQPTIGSNLSTDDGTLYSYGLYVDEKGVVQYLGTYLGSDKDAQVTSFIYGQDNDTGDLTRYKSYTNAGVFMVRNTVVPIPAAIWLFGTGLIALLGIARRKAA